MKTKLAAVTFTLFALLPLCLSLADGTTPSRTNGTTYTGPVSISATTTLKAVAFKDYYVESGVTSGTYTISGGGPTLISHLASNLGTNGGTSSSINTTGANFIVVGISGYNPGLSGTITDSKGNTWTALTKYDASAASQLFYCYNPTVGTGHTFTCGDSGSYTSIAVQAWSGIASSPFNGEAGAWTGSGWTTLQVFSTVTPSQASSIAVALVSGGSGAGTLTIDSSYTMSDTAPYGSGTYQAIGMAYKILTSASAQQPTWTSSSSSANGAASLAIFKGL